MLSNHILPDTPLCLPVTGKPLSPALAWLSQNLTTCRYCLKSEKKGNYINYCTKTRIIILCQNADFFNIFAQCA